MKRFIVGLLSLFLAVAPVAASFQVNNLVGFNVKPPVVAASGGITFVGAIAGKTLDGSNVTLSLTGLGLQQNDIVILFGGHPRSGGANPDVGTTSSGWTQIASTNDVSDGQAYSGYKFMSSSPDTSVVGVASSNSADVSVYVAIAFRGVNTGTPLDTAATTASANSTNPDPASITTVTSGAMVIAAAAQRGNDATITEPSGYSTLSQGVTFETDTDTRAFTAAVSYATKASAGAENPGAYTNWGVSANWTAHTIALRPQ